MDETAKEPRIGNYQTWFDIHFFILNSQITLKNIQNVQLHSLVFVSMHFDEYFRGKNRQAHARTKGF